jgi:DNA-binding transcriptional regulator YdaS (Cro superfamily)
MPEPTGAAEFHAWLRAHHLPQAAAARTLGVTPTAVHDWLHSHRAPSAHFREAIERWTGGAVLAESWLEEHERQLCAQLRSIVPYAGTHREDDGA